MATTLPANLVKVQVRGERLLSPFETEVESLTIETEEDYQATDMMLARISTAIKTWDGEIEPILKPLREAKTAADKLKAKVMKPLEALYQQVRGAMTSYKQEEARQLADARRLEELARAKVNTQIEKVATQELGAKTAQMREKLAQKRIALEEQAEEIEVAPAPVQAAHSQTRTVKRWRVTRKDPDDALLLVLRAILAGMVPLSVVALDTTYINKQPLETVASWPGFEIFDDILVAGRGR